MTRASFFTTSREDGGAEVYLRTVAAAAAARGIDVSCALPAVPATRGLCADLTAAGVTVVPANLGVGHHGRWGALRSIAADVVGTMRVLRRTSAQRVLISLPTPESSPGIMLGCALARRPTCVVFHLANPDLAISPARRRIYAAGRSRRTRWIAVSHDNRRTIAAAFGVPEREIDVIDNGVGAAASVPAEAARRKLRDDLGLAADAKIALTVGRLTPQKGHSTIVAALDRLAAEAPDLHFAWAGSGPLADEMEAAVGAAGHARRVHLLGHRDDVDELLAGSDLLLFPSRAEGRGFALLEAMAAGLPVVTSDIGVLTEVVEDGVTGTTFRVDDPSDLADRLLAALRQPRALAAMAGAARELVRVKYSERDMLDKTVSALLGDEAQ
ncbi:MAG TPA: glycosyltransferase family 4 protein [Solirubrobacteraceae bacterium]|nr:glycosyltransferase family 4 protein [Solirubrobacteraceae bacterium]